MPRKVLKLPAVIERTALSRSSIYAMMDRGEFPRPIRLTRKAVAWPEESIEDWLDSREVAE